MNKNYIFEYYAEIEKGNIVAGRWIKTLYKKIIKGLENKLFFYDEKKAYRAINYIENFCHHCQGELAPGLIKLELWQKALVSLIFGIVDKSGYRHFREVIVVVSRKNGKTLLASAIASYCMFLDGEYGAAVYFAAPKLEQAGLCFDAFYQTILQEKDLSNLAKKRRSDIYVESTNSIAKPLAFNAKKSDGLNPSLCIADEVASWHGGPGIKFYNVIKSAFGARKQPLLVSITTSGYESEGIYDELIKRGTSYLNGNSRESRLLPILYMIDDVEKWNDIEELKKSNPNLGVSVTEEYLLEEIAIAEGSPAKKSEFLTKYCNIKQNATNAWLNIVDIEKCFQKSIRIEDFRNSYAIIGIDLSRTTDLTSCVVLIEKEGIIYVFTKFWMPSETLQKHIETEGIPYNLYVNRGLLNLSGDYFVQYEDCMEYVLELIREYEIYPMVIGYDNYSSQYLVYDLKTNGFITDWVRQGFNLTPVINESEGLIKDGKIQMDKDNDLMKLHMLNAALKIENVQKRKMMVKVNESEHIDGMSALLDGLTVRQKYWNEYGAMLKNE